MEVKNNKEELIKLVKENPELPLVFSVNNGDLAFDYGSTVMEDFYPYIGEFYKYEKFGNLLYSDDINEVLEYYWNLFRDKEEYKDLSNEEYEDVIRNYINQNIEHYKAIIINVW